MTDTLGFGPEMRRQGNLDILAGKDTFRCVWGGSCCRNERELTSSIDCARCLLRPLYTRLLVALISWSFLSGRLMVQRWVPEDVGERTCERAYVRTVQGGDEKKYATFAYDRRYILLTGAGIGLDDGFKEFYDWSKANDLPFVIISRHA